MKKVKIKFSGMSGRFNENHNFIVDILKKKYKVVISEQPDYLFYSDSSKDYLKYDCIRIYYTPENLVPDFNICDYGISYQYIDYEDRYIRYPIYLVDSFIAYENDNYVSELQMAREKHLNNQNLLDYKKEFCSFVYSNSEAVKCREDFFDFLSSYKLVNSGGRYKNNVGGPIDSKLSFQETHKFSIAFENTSSPGYTTEKIVHAFAAKTIPIYWGDPTITRLFNPKAFINCHDYGVVAYGDNEEAFKKILDRIIEIDTNDKLFLEMVNQPTFKEGYNPSDDKSNFQSFLYSIFDQNLENAYRRNRFYWGQRYERKQSIGNFFYFQIRKGIPLRDSVKRILTKFYPFQKKSNYKNR